MRDFSAITTMNEAADALSGSKCLAYTDGVFVFETVAGETFRLRLAAEPVKVSVGEANVQMGGKILLLFENA